VAVAASIPSVRERRRSLVAAVPVYWHLLSLDAPTVAVLWAWSFARAVHVSSAPAALVVLGIGTWLLYITDRLLDGREGAPRDSLRERHFFHARHRRALLVAGAVAAIPLLIFIFLMPPAARLEDAVIFAVSTVYFAVVHLARVRFPRELVVGIVFALACAVPAWSQPGPAHADLAVLALLFAALCWLNCAAIHVWEKPGAIRRWSAVPTLALCVAAASAALMALAGKQHPGVLGLAAATLAAALLLFALDRDHARGARPSAERGVPSVFALRILADAALLTPLLLLIPWRG